MTSHWSGFLLLAIYAVSQTASTLLMPTTMDKTQRYILLALPLVFLFFVANFPAGLVIYWVTTNLWTVGQGLVTRGLRKPPPPPPKRSSRTACRRDAQAAGRQACACACGPAEPASPRSRREKRAGR